MSAPASLPRPRGEPEPGTMAALNYRVARMSGGRCKAVSAALAERQTLSADDLAAIYERHRWPVSPGSLGGTISEIQKRLRGCGWHIGYLDGGGITLRHGENPRARPVTYARAARRPPAMSRPVETLRPAPPVSDRVVAGRRELRVPAAPGGCCQYLVPRDGGVTACGKPSKGTYCDEHRAKSAGLEYRPDTGRGHR